MREPRREELSDLVDKVCQMRHRTTREVGNNPDFVVWSFAVISDLRAKEQDKN
jgi:hypothetical protein